MQDPGALVLDLMLLRHAASAVRRAEAGNSAAPPTARAQEGQHLFDPLTLLSIRLSCKAGRSHVDRMLAGASAGAEDIYCKYREPGGVTLGSQTLQLTDCGAAGWALAAIARGGDDLACMHLLRTHRIYDPEPPERRTPGLFYTTNGRALTAAAEAGQLDVLRLLLRVVVRDARATGHLHNGLDLGLSTAMTAAVQAGQLESVRLMLDPILQHSDALDHNSFWVRAGLGGDPPICGPMVATVLFTQLYNLLFALELTCPPLISPRLSMRLFYVLAACMAAYLAGTLLAWRRRHARLQYKMLLPTAFTETCVFQAIGAGKHDIAKMLVGRGVALGFFGAASALWQGETWPLHARLPETLLVLVLALNYIRIVLDCNKHGLMPMPSWAGVSGWLSFCYAAAFPLAVCWALARGAWKRRLAAQQKKAQ